MITRPIEGFPDYEVSDTGVVISRRRGAPKVLQGSKKHGYVIVSLCRGGPREERAVHQLVAAAFLGPRPEGMEVCHNDGSRDNNALSNLRYGTHRENLLDKQVHGTDHNTVKTHCPQGHPLEGANLYVYPSSGSRACRTCRAAAVRRSKAKRRAA